MESARQAGGHEFTGKANAFATGAETLPGEWNSPEMLAAIGAQDREYNDWLASNPDLSKASSDPLGSFGEFLGAQQQQKIDHDTAIGNMIGAVVIGAATAGIGSEIGGVAASGGSAGQAGLLGTYGSTAGTIAGGAVQGAVAGGVTSAAEGKPIAKGIEYGALGGAFAPVTKALGGEISDVTGMGAFGADALAGAGVGALRGKLSGQGAEVGAIEGGVSGAIAGSGVKSQLGDEIGKPAAGLVVGAGTSELTSLAGSTLTSPTGKSATTTSSEETYTRPPGQFEASSELSPGVAPLAAGAAVAAASSTGPSADLQVGNQPGSSSFLSDVGSGLMDTLGGGSLGNVIGGALPYAAVGGIGIAQAKAGEAQDAKYSQQQQALGQPAITQSNKMLGEYNAGKLSPTDQKVVDTEVGQGNSLINSATGLSKIAQSAFADYSSGKLNPADQLQLDNQVAAQKQQVAQQLATAGITDSTILAAQNQQIDNNAVILRQQLLDARFATGSKAYDQWLTTTTQGQQTIQRGMEFASNSLQTELTNSMAEANIGMGEINTAIQTQMTTDANYAAQVSTLLGTLATAYAKQVAGKSASSAGSTLGKAAGSAMRGGGGGGGSGGGGGGGDPFAGTPEANTTAARGAYNEAGGIGPGDIASTYGTDTNMTTDYSVDDTLGGFDLNADYGGNLGDVTGGF